MSNKETVQIANNLVALLAIMEDTDSPVWDIIRRWGNGPLSDQIGVIDGRIEQIQKRLTNVHWHDTLTKILKRTDTNVQTAFDAVICKLLESFNAIRSYNETDKNKREPENLIITMKTSLIEFVKSEVFSEIDKEIDKENANDAGRTAEKANSKVSGLHIEKTSVEAICSIKTKERKTIWAFCIVLVLLIGLVVTSFFYVDSFIAEHQALAPGQLFLLVLLRMPYTVVASILFIAFIKLLRTLISDIRDLWQRKMILECFNSMYFTTDDPAVKTKIINDGISAVFKDSDNSGPADLTTVRELAGIINNLKPK